MPKPIVLVDVDDVTADWTAMFEVLLRRDYPHITPLAREALTHFYKEELYPPEHRADILKMMHTPGFYRNLDPIPGAIEGVKELASRYEVFFCSAPFLTHDTCASEKIAWIAEHFGTDWTRRLILASDKTMAHGDVLIDDKEHVLGANANPSWKHIVFDAPHNQNSAAPMRAKGWDEVVPLVDRYLNRRAENVWRPSVGFTAR